MSDTQRTWPSMTGEYLREASVLVLVFGWLDKLVFEKDGPSPAWSRGVGAVALILFLIGGMLEKVRRR